MWTFVMKLSVATVAGSTLKDVRLSRREEYSWG